MDIKDKLKEFLTKNMEKYTGFKKDPGVCRAVSQWVMDKETAERIESELAQEIKMKLLIKEAIEAGLVNEEEVLNAGNVNPRQQSAEA